MNIYHSDIPDPTTKPLGHGLTLKFPTPSKSESTAAAPALAAIPIPPGLNIKLPPAKSATVGQWQQQIHALYEPGDQLHLKLIHGKDEWVWVDLKGKEHRKKKTQDVWPSYEDLVDGGFLSQLKQYESEGWNIYICMAVFDGAKIQTILNHNSKLSAGEQRLPRRTEANIATVNGSPVVRTVAIDCDEDGETSRAKVQEAVVTGMIPPPTIVIRSSASPKEKFQFMWATKGFSLEQQAAVNATLQQMFGGDCQAKDTVRVLRLAGFANQKYEGKPPATIVESSCAGRYSFEQFKVATNAQSFARKERPQASSDYIEFVCKQIEDNTEATEQFDLGDCRSYFGTGFIWVQDVCPNAEAHTDGNSAGSYVIVMPSGARVFKCQHKHCAHLNWAWFKDHLNALASRVLDWTDKKMTLSTTEVRMIQDVAAELTKAGTLSDDEAPTDDTKMETVTVDTEVEADDDETKRGREYYETFAGLILELEELDTTPLCGAQIFQIFYNRKYIYAVFEATGKWMKWTGSVWMPAAAQIEMRKALHRLHRILPKYVAPLFKDNADKQKAIKALAAKYKTPNFIDNVCRVLETDLYKMYTDFDRKPHLFNFRNGTLNLNTFVLQAHNPNDMLTRRASVSYNPEAKFPVWTQFLTNCFPTDERKYVQTWFGYCMPGEAPEKAAPIFYGPHDCGKTTIADILTDILGPYAKVASWDSFKISASGEVRNDLADWYGSRFVVCDEGDKRMVMHERTFKTITGGGGKLKVRFFYKDFFEMPIDFKIMFLSNFRPLFADMDPATWSRVHPLRMTNSFAPGRPGRIAGLKRLLRAEREGIVVWMVEGLKMYRAARGLFLTSAMKKEKQEYMAHSDVQAEFFAYRTTDAADGQVELNALHQAHCQWSREFHETEMTRGEFKESLTQRGYKTDWKSTPNGRAEYVFGLSLATGQRVSTV